MAGIYEYISYEWLRIKVATNSWDICYEVATYYKWHHYMVPIDAQGMEYSNVLWLQRRACGV